MEQSQHKPKAGRVTTIENAEGRLATDAKEQEGLVALHYGHWWHSFSLKKRPVIKATTLEAE